MNIQTFLLLDHTAYSGNGEELVITGDKMKAANYHTCGFGRHTFLYELETFTGAIHIQGTLASLPNETDWADIVVDTYSELSTGHKIRNVSGNFVFVRAIVKFTNGTVKKILVNY